MTAIDNSHVRPPGVSDADVYAAGLMSEAFERIERARGALYDAHQLIGGADNSLDEVVSALRAAERDDLADELGRQLIGIDVIEGRWTFQLIEEFDDEFFATWRDWEQRVRDELTAGRRHLFEADLKAKRQA